MNFEETDKALEGFSQLHNNDCAIHRLEKCDCDQYGIKPFLHHRIELEVEKAVKTKNRKIDLLERVIDHLYSLNK